jgi:hypothetical protein
MAEQKEEGAPRLSDHEIRLIAALAWTTPTSVRNWIAGRPQKPILASRIATTMRQQGYEA